MIAKHFEPAVAYAQSIVANANANQMADPTPCSEWDVRALLNHMVNEHLWAPPLLAGESVTDIGDRFDGDNLGDDFKTAFSAATKLSTEAAAAPGAMTRNVKLSTREISGEDYLSEMTLDAVIHGWDLAKATGQDTTIPQQFVQALLEYVTPMADMLANSGVFGAPPQFSPTDAPQIRLLAMLGRVA